MSADQQSTLTEAMPRLTRGERIVTVYAEPARGSGWSNEPLWVVIAARDHSLRQVCLQPEEYGGSVKLMTLYPVAAAVHDRLKIAVEEIMRG